MNFADGLRESFPKSFQLFQIIGALILLKKVWSLLTSIYKLLRKRRNLQKRYGPNTWAFITGSSDGIGKALAFSLARAGFNVIISARTQSKLQQIQKQIKQKYPGRQVKLLVADYKQSIQWKSLYNVLQSISQLDISIVINNVGVDYFDKYVEIDPQVIKDMLSINCFPVAFISKFFLPILKKRTQITGRKCALVNISSTASLFPFSYFNVYAATKSYVDRLTLSLKHQNPQLDIVSIRPSEVSTPMTGNKDLDIFTISANDCAEGILDQLGYDAYAYGHWRHKLQGWLYESIPQNIFMFIYEKIFVPDEYKRRKQKK